MSQTKLQPQKPDRVIELAMCGGCFTVHTDVDWPVPQIAQWLFDAGWRINMWETQFAWPGVELVVMKPGKILKIVSYHCA